METPLCNLHPTGSGKSSVNPTLVITLINNCIPPGIKKVHCVEKGVVRELVKAFTERKVVRPCDYTARG